MGGKKRCYSLKTSNRKQAKKLRDAILHDRSIKVRLGLLVPLPTQERRFREVADLCFQARRANSDLRPPTIKAFESNVRNWILPFFGHLLMSDIDLELVESFITYLRTTRSKRINRPLARDTVANVFGNLRTIYRMAVKRRWHLGPNPLEQLDRVPTAGPGRKVALTEDEAKRLLAQLSGELHYKTALALHTGLRWGEVHGLDWRHDLVLAGEQPTLTVRRSWTGEPKNEASKATIPLTTHTVELLRRWRVEQGLEAKYVFPDRKGELRRGKHRYDSDRIKEAAKQASIDKNVHPHTFRHSFGTWTYERTRDPKLVQRLMRHASFKTSMGYVHDDRDLREVIEQMPILIGAQLKSA